MKLLAYQFQPETLVDPENGPYIEVVYVTDLHWGHPTFMPKKAKKHRQYILDSPDRKAVDLGDHVENAIRSSPGDSALKQKGYPEEQLDQVADFYEPIRDRLLAITTGNHEDRSERDAGISADKWLTTKLDCPWVKWEAVLSITAGDSRRGQQYTIYMRHAISNSSKPHVVLGAMLNKAKSVQGMDVYAFGHNHMYLYQPLPTMIADPRHGKVRKKEQHFVMGDCFFEHDGSYAEQHDYPLATEGQFSLKLYQNKHLVEVKRLLY